MPILKVTQGIFDNRQIRKSRKVISGKAESGAYLLLHHRRHELDRDSRHPLSEILNASGCMACGQSFSSAEAVLNSPR